MITIYYSSSFKKSVKKRSSYKKQIKKRIETFIKDPHHPSLKTHKLKGELAGYCGRKMVNRFLLQQKLQEDS